MKRLPRGQIKKRDNISKRLTRLAAKGMIRLPKKRGKLSPFKAIKTVGKPASNIILDDRR
jgi:hypothetical protein